MKNPCISCPFKGRGSEHCIAGVGDFCRANHTYIEETEKDKKFLQEILDKPSNPCYNIVTTKERN